MTGKKTLQPEVAGEKREKQKGGQSLAETKKGLLLELEIQEINEKLEAKKARFKTADEYQKALEQVYVLQESNRAKEQELAEREKVLEPREKALAQLQKETEKAIKYAEALKPLGEDRERIKQLLVKLRDKVIELVNLPDAFVKYNKYGVDKEHDRLYVEIMSMIRTWNDTISECRKSVVK